MKRVIISTAMLIIASCLILFHYNKITKFDEKSQHSYTSILSYYEDGDFLTIEKELKNLKNEWDSIQGWAGLTIDNSTLDEIETSLLRCIKYAEIEDSEDFIGELIYFNQLIKNLHYFEHLNFESLL